jgi:hypothetical protein
VRFVIFAVTVVVAGLGCSKAQIRAYESHACSVSDDDDPFYICSPAYDLICINTYRVTVTNPEEAKKFDGGQRPVWVCRLACATRTDCPQAGDVCCEGVIHGKDYGKKAGCVPAALCESMMTSGNEDGGGGTPAPDAAAPDAPSVDARDAGAADASSQ